MSAGGKLGRGALRVATEMARDRVEEVGRELTRPWRRGREGPAAEAGRWIGLGLAVGAFVAGVAAGVLAGRRD